MSRTWTLSFVILAFSARVSTWAFRPGKKTRTVMHALVSASATRFWLLIVMSVMASLPASALTKIFTVPFNTNWSETATSGWGCGDALPILRNGTFPTSFNGGLPAGSTVRHVKITMPMRRAGTFRATGDADPVVTVSIGGEQIAVPTVVAGYYACPYVADLIPYTFDQAFPDGFAAYDANGPNALDFTVQGGTCPSWCGVTTDDPMVTLEVTYDLPPPADFAITSQAPEPERRILISNVRTSYPYPHFQFVGGAVDAEVTTFLRARNPSGNFQSGLTVYMRVLDPPDSAPYMNQAGNVLAHNNDNEGGTAILDGPGVTVHSPGIYQATSGANGHVGFTLRLQAPFVAGDNYQVETSLDPGFPSGGTAKSGILTAWKRVFIEKRRMLKNGLFLAQNANAGDTFIITRGNRWRGNQTSNDELSKNEKIVITHGPQLDRSDLNAGWYYETHTILSVQDLNNGQYRVNLGRKQGNTVIVEQLQHDYKIDTQNGSIGDAISKLDTLTLGPDDYFDASPDLVTGEAFFEAFTENIYLPDTTTPGALVPVPHLETAHEPTLQSLAEKWSSVVINGALLPNHQLLIVASDNSPVGDGTDAGVTISQVMGKTSSYVFRATIEQVLPGNNTATADKWVMKTSAHEIAHQWQTNGVWNLKDHCPMTTKAHDDSSLYCLLAAHDPNGAGSVAQRTNGIARFHLLPLPAGGWHSEYLGIRRRPDPFVP